MSGRRLAHALAGPRYRLLRRQWKLDGLVRGPRNDDPIVCRYGRESHRCPDIRLGLSRGLHRRLHQGVNETFSTSWSTPSTILGHTNQRLCEIRAKCRRARTLKGCRYEFQINSWESCRRRCSRLGDNTACHCGAHADSPFSNECPGGNPAESVRKIDTRTRTNDYAPYTAKCARAGWGDSGVRHSVSYGPS